MKFFTKRPWLFVLGAVILGFVAWLGADSNAYLSRPMPAADGHVETVMVPKFTVPWWWLLIESVVLGVAGAGFLGAASYPGWRVQGRKTRVLTVLSSLSLLLCVWALLACGERPWCWYRFGTMGWQPGVTHYAGVYELSEWVYGSDRLLARRYTTWFPPSMVVLTAILPVWRILWLLNYWWNQDQAHH